MVHQAISRFDYLTSEAAKNLSETDCLKHLRETYKNQPNQKKYESLATTIQAGNGEQLPLEDGVADAVVGNLLLHLTPNPEKVIQESFRLLTKEGRMSFSAPANRSHCYLIEAFIELGVVLKALKEGVEVPPELPKPETLPRIYTVGSGDTLKNMAVKAGFKSILVWEVYMPYNGSTEEEVYQVLAQTPGVSKARLEKPEEVEKVVREVSRKWYKKATEDGRPFGFETKVILATKE